MPIFTNGQLHENVDFCDLAKIDDAFYKTSRGDYNKGSLSKNAQTELVTYLSKNTNINKASFDNLPTKFQTLSDDDTLKQKPQSFQKGDWTATLSVQETPDEDDPDTKITELAVKLTPKNGDDNQALSFTVTKEITQIVLVEGVRFPGKVVAEQIGNLSVATTKPTQIKEAGKLFAISAHDPKFQVLIKKTLSDDNPTLKAAMADVPKGLVPDLPKEEPPKPDTSNEQSSANHDDQESGDTPPVMKDNQESGDTPPVMKDNQESGDTPPVMKSGSAAIDPQKLQEKIDILKQAGMNDKEAKAKAVELLTRELKTTPDSSQPSEKPAVKVTVEMNKPLKAETDFVKWLKDGISGKDPEASKALAFITLPDKGPGNQNTLEHLKWLDNKWGLGLFKKGEDKSETVTQLLKDFSTLKKALIDSPDTVETIAQCFGPKEALADYQVKPDGSLSLTTKETFSIKLVKMGKASFAEKFDPSLAKEGLDLTAKLANGLTDEGGLLAQTMKQQFGEPATKGKMKSLAELLDDVYETQQQHDTEVRFVKDWLKLKPAKGVESFIKMYENEGWMQEPCFTEGSSLRFTKKYVFLTQSPKNAEGQDISVHSPDFSGQSDVGNEFIKSFKDFMGKHARTEELQELGKQMKIATVLDTRGKGQQSVVLKKDVNPFGDEIFIGVDGKQATSAVAHGLTGMTKDGHKYQDAFHAIMTDGGKDKPDTTLIYQQQDTTQKLIQGVVDMNVMTDSNHVVSSYHTVPYATFTSPEVFATGTATAG